MYDQWRYHVNENARKYKKCRNSVLIQQNNLIAIKTLKSSRSAVLATLPVFVIKFYVQRLHGVFETTVWERCQV